MNTLVVLPAVNEILDAARLLESNGIKFTTGQIQDLIAACLRAMAQDIEFITEEVEAIADDMLADLPAASRAIN